MTQEELKPCPFCGGEAEYHSDKGPTGEVYGWVGCNQCDAMSCHIDTRSMQPEEQHPIDAWNTRAADTADYRNRAERAEAELAEVRAEAERLQGAIQRCLEELYAPPANCSCHLGPPCSDCVEYAGIREAEEVARAALNGGKP